MVHRRSPLGVLLVVMTLLPAAALVPGLRVSGASRATALGGQLGRLRDGAPKRTSSLVLAASMSAADDNDKSGSRSLLEHFKSTRAKIAAFCDKNYFLVGLVTAVALAGIAPGIGRKGGPLMPELTVAWGATCSIFVLAGLNLPTSELRRAAMSLKEHTLIQSINLALIPLAMLPLCNALLAGGLLSQSLRDGMLVMSALPTTVNMCVALSRSSAGDEALAIFNAVLGNLLGVSLRRGSPAARGHQRIHLGGGRVQELSTRSSRSSRDSSYAGRSSRRALSRGARSSSRAPRRRSSHHRLLHLLRHLPARLRPARGDVRQDLGARGCDARGGSPGRGRSAGSRACARRSASPSRSARRKDARAGAAAAQGRLRQPTRPRPRNAALDPAPAPALCRLGALTSVQVRRGEAERGVSVSICGGPICV